MKKLNKHLKRVLGLSFVLLVCAPFTLISAQDKENDLPTQENAPERFKTPNRARVDDEIYTSYNIGYNNDYQENYVTGVYEFETGQGIYSYVFRLYDFYAVVRDDGSVNDGNIYGIGFTYSYELFSCDSDCYANHSIEDYGTSEFYADYNYITPVPLNRAYNLYNANFNLNFTRSDEMLYVDWTITLNSGQVYLASTNAAMFFDLSDYVQFYDILLEWKMSLSLPVTQLYYSFNYGNNYDQGYDDGRNSVLDNLDQTKTEAYTEGYQKGFDTAKNMYEDLAENPMNWTMLAESIITLPSKIIKTGFDFDIFGVNVGEFIQTVIVIALVIFCVRLFTGNGGSS